MNVAISFRMVVIDTPGRLYRLRSTLLAVAANRKAAAPGTCKSNEIGTRILYDEFARAGEEVIGESTISYSRWKSCETAVAQPRANIQAAHVETSRAAEASDHRQRFAKSAGLTVLPSTSPEYCPTITLQKSQKEMS